MPTQPSSTAWPALPLEEWQDTYATLHMWLQIVGKIRLVQSPWLNHSWHVTSYVTASGLTTSPIPYGDRTFQLDFDFMDHQLIVQTSDGPNGHVLLRPQSVAAFYANLMAEMSRLGLHVKIKRKPNEVEDAIRFDQDETHRAYDGEYANRFWRILVQTDRILKDFRARFAGKASPVHLFWGGADLAVTRFSGPAGADASGWHSQPGGLGDPGSVLARGQQLRILARQRCGRVSGVLFVRLSRTGRVCRRSRAAGGCLLQQRLSRVHPSVRCRSPVTVAGRLRCSSSCRPLTMPQLISLAGIVRPWNGGSIRGRRRGLGASRLVGLAAADIALVRVGPFGPPGLGLPPSRRILRPHARRSCLIQRAVSERSQARSESRSERSERLPRRASEESHEGRSPES